MACRRPTNRMTRQAIVGQVGTVSKAIGQSYVSYHPLLATVTGNVKAALLLSHAISWSRYVHFSQPGRDAWFWLRATDWQEGSGLTVREQATARNILKGMGILEEKRIGVPARNWYRLDLEKLGRMVAESTGRAFDGWSWDRAAMFHLLGPPIPCHRVLIKVAKSVVGGLILSHLYRATRIDLSDGGDGEWMHIPIGHARGLLGITPKQQRTARERLRQAGLVDEVFEKAVQPKLLTRLNLGLLALECANKAHELPCLQDSANKIAISCTQELPNAQIWSCPKRETGDAQSANLAVRKGPLPIKKENYKREPLQQPAPEAPTSSPAPAVCRGSGGETIILPEKILAGEATVARHCLMPLPVELRQQVADEWAGLLALDARGIRRVHNRLGLLSTLVKRAKGLDSEQFTPSLAFEVAATRQRRQVIEAMRQQHQPNDSDMPPRASRAAAQAAMAEIAKFDFMRTRP